MLQMFSLHTSTLELPSAAKCDIIFYYEWPDVTDGAVTDTDGIIGDTAASPSAAVTDNAANTASPEIGTDTTAAPKK